MPIDITSLEFAYPRGRFRFTINDLSIPTGLTFLLGRNGSGKSTLINLLTLQLRSKNGHINGRPGSIGYVPQRPQLPLDFTTYDALEYSARINGVPAKAVKTAVNLALKNVDLTEVSQQEIRNLSGGMQRRLAVVCAGVHKPQLLVLDEPTNDLDPVQRKHLMEVISEHARETTVIVATHFLHEIARPHDNVILLDEGRVTFSGTAAEFTGNDGAATGARISLEDAFILRTGSTPT